MLELVLVVLCVVVALAVIVLTLLTVPVLIRARRSLKLINQRIGQLDKASSTLETVRQTIEQISVASEQLRSASGNMDALAGSITQSIEKLHHSVAEFTASLRLHLADIEAVEGTTASRAKALAARIVDRMQDNLEPEQHEGSEAGQDGPTEQTGPP